MKSMARVIRQLAVGPLDRAEFSGDLAAMVNPVVAGWINYYGRFYKSGLIRLPGTADQPISGEVGMTEVQTVAPCTTQGASKLAEIASVYPGMFAHWRHGACRLVRRWEPCDGRLSRTVLRAAAGEIPAAD